MSNNSIPNRQGYYPPPPNKKRSNKLIPILIAVGALFGGGLFVKGIFSSDKKTNNAVDYSSVIVSEPSDGEVNSSSLDNDSQESNDSVVNMDSAETEAKSNSVSIDALSDSTLRVEKITDNTLSLGETVVEHLDGSISSEGQEDSYNFTPEIDGVYRFEFSNIPNNIHHSIYLYNSSGEELDRNTGIGNGSGVTANLNGEQSYVVKVKQSWNTGSYTLNIGHQKPSETITGLTQVSDSIQFTDQENDYLFVPEIDGIYRFEFSDIPNDIHHSLYVYNSSFEELDRNTGIGNGSGITIGLSGGQEYHVVVKQSWNLGSYKLNIGNAKPNVDISESSIISDSIQFTNQENNYSFTPDETGLYRFEFANIPNDIHHSIYVYNDKFEELDRNTGIGNGSGISIKLNASETYYVVIKQSWNTGSYDLLVGKQKKCTDISECVTVSDSIQFTDQENNYIFTPTTSKEVSFSFSNIPDDVHVSIYVYNSNGEEIGKNTGIWNDSGVDLSLNSGSAYYVLVKQNWNYGKYTLNIH